MPQLLVAIPVCHKDVHLVERNLERCIQLGKKASHNAIVCWDGDVSGQIEKIIAKAEAYFDSVTVFKYSPWRGNSAWPHPQNYAWQSVARFLESSQHSEKGWLWWEADATPVTSNWLDVLTLAYTKSRCSFYGNIVEGRGHMNGVAIYPFQISNFCTNALLAKTVPFDVVLSSECKKQGIIGRGNDYIAHSLKRFGGEEPGALDASLLGGLPSTVVLFHGCTMGQGPMRHSLEAVPTDRPTLMQVLTAWRCGKKKYLNGDKPAKKLYDFTISIERPKVWHVTERHKTDNQDAERRTIQAEESWVEIYRDGGMNPCHLWRYPRSSKSIGDTRDLPFLKDVLAEGLTKCGERDVVLWTNDDTILHPDSINAALKILSRTGACSSFRVNFEKGKMPKTFESPDKIRSLGKFDLGRDLFAFRSEWLIQNWKAIPDFYLGELEFDLVLAVLIRKLAGQATTKVNIHDPVPVCELERGYVLHEIHARSWVTKEHEKSPAKAWNQKICREWYSDHGFHALISKPMPI
ncbi:MAG: hypothetical protein O2960_24805 [Verrucomicrobia bacterium]|jgi:hypothetical protein|nr:hypothetical protein [Verrucomicrobiota bacterium]